VLSIFIVIFTSCVGKLIIWVHNWKNGRGNWNLEAGNLKDHFDKSISEFSRFVLSAVIWP
jgi:hypothetical protein